MKTHATAYMEVYVDPVSILKDIHIIDREDWIVKKGKKYIQSSTCDYESLVKFQKQFFFNYQPILIYGLWK